MAAFSLSPHMAFPWCMVCCRGEESKRKKERGLSLVSLLKKNYLFLAVLGLHCCTWAFSSCGEQGLLCVVCRLLTAVASRCRAWALGTQASVVAARGLSSCGSQALEHRLSSCGARA